MVAKPYPFRSDFPPSSLNQWEPPRMQRFQLRKRLTPVGQPVLVSQTHHTSSRFFPAVPSEYQLTPFLSLGYRNLATLHVIILMKFSQ